MLTMAQDSRPGAAAREAAQAVRDAARRGRATAAPQVESLLTDIDELLIRLERVAQAQRPRRRWLQKGYLGTRVMHGARRLSAPSLRAARAGNALVRARPWVSVGVAALAGAVLGAFIYAERERLMDG